MIEEIFMKRNQVVLIYGLPASGKYTVAKEIQKQCGGILLDNHYFFDMFIGMTENTDEEWYKYASYVGAVRRAFLNVLQHFYTKERNTRYIFTAALLREERLPARLRKFAQSINADFIPIELKVRPEVLLARCDTKARRERKKLHDKNRYNDLLKQWLPSAFHSRHPNKLILDSSELSLEETVEQIKQYLKKFD